MIKDLARESGYSLYTIKFYLKIGLIKEVGRSFGSSYRYFMVGLAQSDPLRQALDKYRGLELKSNIYVAHFEDGRAAYNALDDRMPYLEIGIL